MSLRIYGQAKTGRRRRLHLLAVDVLEPEAQVGRGGGKPAGGRVIRRGVAHVREPWRPRSAAPRPTPGGSAEAGLTPVPRARRPPATTTRPPPPSSSSAPTARTPPRTSLATAP